MSPSAQPASYMGGELPRSKRLRVKLLPVTINSEGTIRKVLAVDGFEINNLVFNDDTVIIMVKNTKFRSTAQAVGRVAVRYKDLQLTMFNLLIFRFLLRRLI